MWGEEWFVFHLFLKGSGVYNYEGQKASLNVPDGMERIEYPWWVYSTERSPSQRSVVCAIIEVTT